MNVNGSVGVPLIAEGTSVVNRATIFDHDDDGDTWSEYQDDEGQQRVRRGAHEPSRVDVARDIDDLFYENPFPGSRRASLCRERVICKNKCDVDSISLTSSSMLKIAFRLGTKLSKFVFKTKINQYNVDNTSRAYIKYVEDLDRPRDLNFKPMNSTLTTRLTTNRMCRFANISLAEVTVNACTYPYAKFFICGFCSSVLMCCNLKLILSQ
jgi:hypothetical protein